MTAPPVNLEELKRLYEAAFKYLAPGPWSNPLYGTLVWTKSLKGGETHIFDVRGWGYLTGHGDGALALDESTAIAAQMAWGSLVAAAVNSIPALLTLARQGQAAQKENERLKAEVSSLRASAGEPTGAEPIGCPCPGACSSIAAQAEVTRLQALVDEAAGVLSATRTLVSEGATDSFTSHEWMQRLFENQQPLSRTLTRLRAQPNTTKQDETI